MKLKANLHKLRLRAVALSKKRNFRVACTVFVALFFIINIGLYGYYKERTYPRTTLEDIRVGSVENAGLSEFVSSTDLLPEQVTLVLSDTKIETKTADLGISFDQEATLQQLQTARSWLPIYNLIVAPKATAAFSVNDDVFSKLLAKISAKYGKKPVDAQITLENKVFVVKDSTDGNEIDVESAKTTVLNGLLGGQPIELPTKVVTAKTTAKELEKSNTSLNAQLKTQVTYTFAGKESTLDPTKVFARKGQSYQLSNSLIESQVTSIGASFGIRVANTAGAVSATQKAIAAGSTLKFALEELKAERSYSYCVAARGVATSNLGTLRTKLISVYGDKRGWSLNGRVNLDRVNSGCDFTVWLSAASQMPTFGAICDSMWSCRVGANVVINFDRWQGASPAWNAAGGSLDEYRAMVINHETGHWFEFGHSNCGGSGQPAPVMQQQSINLQGCKFNAWPTSSERARLANALGI